MMKPKRTHTHTHTHTHRQIQKQTPTQTHTYTTQTNTHTHTHRQGEREEPAEIFRNDVRSDDGIRMMLDAHHCKIASGGGAGQRPGSPGDKAGHSGKLTADLVTPCSRVARSL